MKITKEELTKNHILIMALTALVLNITIELLSRSSFVSVLTHIITSPIFFVFNILIISLTLCISLFFKRKIFVMIIVSLVWLTLGIGNFVVLSYRITPFAFIDLFIFKLNLAFLQSYLTIGLTISILIILIVFTFILVMGFKKCESTEIKSKESTLFSVALAIILSCFYGVCLSTGILEHRITNMAQSYHEYGFVTCFVRSSFERGIQKPESYSEELVAATFANITNMEHNGENTPNIIYVQLESFFDPSLLIDTVLSENPIPTFTYLRENFTSGVLNVAVVGAGTANTEFEIITGMNVDFFGTGEYPYNTFLLEQTCDSLAFNLKELGYTTFAIHNNTATFYERHEVYPNLGFDYFISSEFMTNTTTTDEGWIKDKHLVKEIMKCLTHSEKQDFIFTISVQGHGAFPKEGIENPMILVKSSPFEEILKNQIEYSVNQIYEMDQFILQLINEVNSLREPSVIIFYGDHLPSLEIDETHLTTNNNYQTEYVIWSNLELEEQDQELETFQLTAKLMKMLDLDGGIISDFHQAYSDNTNYLDELELLQYDMIYGEHYSSYGNVFQPTNMIMGVGEIELSTYVEDEYLILYSNDLTDSAKVYANDKHIDSEFSDGKLYILLEDLEEINTLQVRIISSDYVVLYETIVNIFY